MSSSRLDRFVDAQAEVFETALGEIRAGRKRTHWMWFVFPQLAGLGRSATAIHYGLAGLDEAQAYLAHPLLGDRLRRCVEAVLENRGMSATELLGSPDDAKLRSCLTLFEAAASADGDRSLFRRALLAFYDGVRDDRTLSMIGSGGPAEPADGSPVSRPAPRSGTPAPHSPRTAPASRPRSTPPRSS